MDADQHGADQHDAQTAAALDTFERYVRAFETLDPAAITRYFHEPCVMVSPQGVSALPSHADVARFFAPLMGELRAQGYASSELARIYAHRLSDSLTMIGGEVKWRTTNGDLLRHFGLTYLLQKREEGWQIAAAAVHDSDRVLEQGLLP